ncbi:MAG: PadR family transcriptional regulator [Sporolactobacillus sp.]
MKQTQLLKGVLEGCVLLLLSDTEVYGYDMVQQLKATGFKDIVAGTVYPLLQKLEKQGYLSSRMKPSPDGPDRKYYQITQQGTQHYQEFMIQWDGLTTTVNQLIESKRR